MKNLITILGVGLLTALIHTLEFADGNAKKAPPIPPGCLTVSANAIGIPDPTSTKTYSVTDAGHTLQVPANMVYIPAGDFNYGSQSNQKTVYLDGYCIGKFDVTNAEYKAFLDVNASIRPPQYWSNGSYPNDKANHPVA